MMADLFVSTMLHPDLTMEGAVEDVEVDAVDEVALTVEDAVADVVALLPVEVDEEVLEVAAVEAQTVGALEISKARSRPSHKGHKALQRGQHAIVDTAAQSSL